MGHFERRAFLAASAAALAIPGMALAAAYPERPIRLIVPYPPGGGTDAFARTVGPRMAEALGQPVVIDNRPGASSTIGATAVAHAPADGYTMLLGDMGTFSVNRSMFRKLAYDSFTDFAPVGLTARLGLLVVVGSAVPARTLEEFVALARAQPGALSYGTPGTGTPHHLAMELLLRRAGVTATHVPYKGAGPAMQDLLGGQIPVLLTDLATASQHLRGGKLRVLAQCGARRLPQIAEVPTVAEAGGPALAGYDVAAWQGFAVPAATPPAAIAALNAAYLKAAAEPAVRQRMADLGGELTPGTPQAMDEQVRREAALWQRIVREANITID